MGHDSKAIEADTRVHPPSVPPLFPIYLPMDAQHAVLVRLQRVLELACYDYGKRALPELLHRRAWDCAEAVELNRWAQEFKKGQHKLPGRDQVQVPLTQLLMSIANIRHTAVHRIRVSAKSIEQFLLDAEALAVLLGDARLKDQIVELRRQTVATVEELQRNQQFLRSKLNDTLRSIEAQREELKRLEELAIAEMEEEDVEYKNLASKSISEAVATSEASFSTAPEANRAVVVDNSHRDLSDNEDFEDMDDDWASTTSSPEE